MSNRSWDNSLQQWNAEYRELARMAGLLVALMFLLRALAYIVNRESFPSGGAETTWAFLMGLRFDILVAGFWLIVPVLTGTAKALARFHIPRWPLLLKAYVSVMWLFFILVHGADQLFFAARLRHLSIYDLERGDLSFVNVAFEHLGGTTFVLLGGVVFFAGLLGLRWIWESFPAKSSPVLIREGLVMLGLRVFVPILLTSLAARGTVTPHHLDQRHSEISENRVLNSWVLNSVWAFDKKPDALP